jgi:hypothetical protein
LTPLAGQSYRDTYDASVDAPACAGCHLLLDGPGHALERFDDLGRVQQQDAGEPIRTDGTLLWSLDGGTEFQPFDDTAAFVDDLAESPLVGTCLAAQAAALS